MNLNEIQLPYTVIADLYKKSLVEIPQITNSSANVPAKDIQAESFQYMGNNHKQIVIVVHYTDQPFIPDQQLTFLIAVLKACNLTLEDTAIVNFATFKPDYDLVVQQMLPRILLLFGVGAKSIAIFEHLNQFEPVKLDGISVLHVPELEELNRNDNEGKQLKKKLWSALKHIFDSSGNE